MSRGRLLFITGASRSGTTLLSFVLRNHPEVFGLKELQYFGETWDPRQPKRRLGRAEAVESVARMLATQEQGVFDRRSNQYHRAVAAQVVNALGDRATDPAEVFRAAAMFLADAAGKTIPCEQTPRYVFYAGALLEEYEDAHVVHVVRDPRAVMASQKMRWRRRKLAANGVRVPRYESLRVWVNYHPYTVARLWAQATRAAVELEGHPRMTLLRFEDLVREPEATVRALCGRLDLEYDERLLDVGQVNSSHQSAVAGARRGLHADAVDRWREMLTRSEIAITERRCGDLMQRFGYAADGVTESLAGKLGYRLSYAAHAGAVVAVNPRRALVQARAVLRSRSAPRSGGPPQGDPRPDEPQGPGPSATEYRELLGLRFWDVDLDRAARHVVQRAADGHRLPVTFVNAHCVNVAARDPAYAQWLQSAPLLFADGVGMALAARLAGTSLQHNVNGTDLFPRICRAAADAGVPVAFLGAKPGIARACAERMTNRHPGLQVVWTEHGYLAPDEEAARLSSLAASGARILFVAKGVPAQEHWIARHAATLPVPVVLGVGALFDFYSGTVRRAPPIVRHARLEWAYRLLLEPRRLAGRYLLGNPEFIARAAWSRRRSPRRALTRQDGEVT